MITRAKLDAFLAAARDLGASSVNYIAPEPDHPREIVSLTMDTREATIATAAALGMPAPRELPLEDGSTVLWTSALEGRVSLKVSSRPESEALVQAVAS